jgi:hypothetical protein
MVLKRRKTLLSSLQIILLFMALFVLQTCNKDYIAGSSDCSECLSFEPYDADLYVKVSLSNENRYIPVVVLKGKLEEHDTIAVDTISSATGYISVPLNHYYTVVATYQSGDNIIRAVDGDEMKKFNRTDVCGDICWVIKGGIINVTIE